MAEDYHVIAVGTSGERVRRVQARLLDTGATIGSEELVEGMFGVDTKRALEAFQMGNSLWAHGSVDAVTRQALDQASAAQANYVVGRVLGPDGQPVAGITVHAYDRDLRSEQELGVDTTGDDGYYRITYSSDADAELEEGTVDVFVRAYLGDQQLTDPPMADTVFNAPQLVSIIVNLTVTTRPRQTEWERLVADVQPLLGRLPWTQLAQDADHSDVTFLVGETGWAAEQVQHAAVGYRMSNAYVGPPYFYYAVFCSDVLLSAQHWTTLTPRFTIDLGTSLPELLYDIVLLPRDQLAAAVEAKVAAFVVPSRLSEELPKIIDELARYQQQARDYVTQQRADVLIGQLQDAFTSDAREQVLALFASDPLGDFNSVLDTLATAGTIAAAPGAETTGRLILTDLIGDDSGVIDHLKTAHGITGVGDEHRLAALSTQDWAAAIRAADGGSAPAAADQDVVDQDKADQDKVDQDVVDRKATAMAGAMAARYPTTAFAAGLGRGEAVSHAQAVSALLSEHHDFDLANGNVMLLVKDHEARSGTPVDAGTKASLAAVQRVAKIAPRYQQSQALLDRGITSAGQVQVMGRNRFVAEAQATGEFTADEAQRTFQKASDIHTGALLLAGQLISATGAGVVAAIAGPAPEKLTQVVKDFPNMQSLFSLGDVCECDECRAVDGAAAYLVDVLQFLKSRLVLDTTTTPVVATKTAKDVLFARRPDLGDLDLTCANTNTELPYLDVVCELLEQAVAPDPGVPYAGVVAGGIADPALVTLLAAQGWAFTTAAAVYGPDLAGCFTVRDTAAAAKLTPAGAGWVVRRTLQTFGSAAQVGAAPAYVNAAAYSTLANAVYAFGLPFDLAHEETRAYFGQFDLSRADLMALLQTAGVPSDVAIAAERLGLSEKATELVTSPAPAGQQGIWNTPSSPAADTLSNVDAFVTRAGITYEDLLVLVDLPWLDGGEDLFIQSLDSSCDLSEKKIVNLDDTALDRLHRFLRLRNASGWDSATLDRAIRSPMVGVGLLDESFLTRQATLTTLSAELGLTPDAVLDLLDPLDLTAPVGTYAATFLDPSIVGAVDPEFQPTAVLDNETAVPGSGVKLADHIPFLAVALGRTAPDTTGLVGFAGLNVALTTASISRAYAGSRLARAVGLSVTDFLGLVDLLGTDPLLSLDSLAAFVDVMTTMAAASVSVPGLRYLLLHSAPDLAVVDLSADTVSGVLTSLDAAYAAARLATASPVTAGATPTENATAVRTQLGQLPGLPVADQATYQTLLTDAWTSATLTEDAFVDATLSSFVDTTPIKAALAVRAAAPAPKDAAQNALLTVLSQEVSGYLYTAARRAALLAAVEVQFTLPESTADVLLGHAHLKAPTSAGSPLLRDLLMDDTTTPAAVDLKTRALELIHTIVVAATPHALDDANLAWLLDNAEALGWLQWDALPYDSAEPPATYPEWSLLQSFLTLSAALPQVADPADPTHPYQLTGVFDLVLAGGTAADVLDYYAVLAGLDAPTLLALDAQLTLSTPDLSAYHDPATLNRLTSLATMLRQLGLDVPTAVEMTKTVLDLGDAAAMRMALKTRYSDADWYGVLKQIQDPLRGQKRDALVAFLLAVNPDLVDGTDLYDWFLIDVEMGQCMSTSRIVQAHATVQLFVMRCLMGLEPTSVASVGTDDGWKQWDWMANFRVWQANRKIFLFPENWALPSTRDQKTELFQALDNQLQQNPITDDTTTDATAAYLEGLDDLAHLDVMACYYGVPTKVMNVFARTKGGDPTTYFYRQFQQERSWTPWTTVPLDIQGDALLAFDRNTRLTLAWPIFSKEAQADVQPPDTPDPAALSGGQANQKANKRWTIKLAISELSGTTWRPKKVSKGFLATPWAEDLPDQDEFNFFVWGLGAAQAITCLGPDGQVGSFALTGCKGYPEPNDASGPSGWLTPRFRDTALQANRFAELNQDATNDLSIEYLLGNASLILQETPGLFEVTYPLQMTIVDWVLLVAEMWALAKSGGNARTYAVAERRPAIPVGTLLPYFFGDYDRTYVMVPGLYQRRQREQDPTGVTIGPADDPVNPADPGQTQVTFSDIVQLLEDLLALLMKYLKTYQADPTQDVKELVKTAFKDPAAIIIREELKVWATLRYGLKFENFYHPLVCLLRSTLNSSGLPAMLARDIQLTTTDFSFQNTYQPSGQVVTPYPVEDFDFTLAGAYSAYNWELFFHLPFDMAVRANTDQQFQAARDWYHYIFDPVGAGDGPAPNTYWKTKPFFLTSPGDYTHELIDNVMYAIAADPTGATITELAHAVQEWRENPFKPDVVARSRPVAYQMTIVINYIKNMIGWADSLFRQFTRESVTQATQLYILAEKLLGPKPRNAPPVVEPPPMSFNQLEPDIDLFGNALLDVENLIPDLNLLPHKGAELPPPPATLSSLYFCIPPNENLLAMWDLVDQRLLMIRTCRNIDGVQASLALFSPPIDPGALVRAVAAGLDLSAFVAGLGAPLPFYRFRVLSQKATELTSQVAALSNELLSVLERRDGEAMARLRGDHEVSVLQSMRDVKVAGLAEAQGTLDGLTKSRAVVQKKFDYYSGLQYMNAWEDAAVVLNSVSLLGEIGVAIANALSGGLKAVPNFTIGAAGFGGSPMATVGEGGTNIGGAAESAAAVLSTLTRAADKGAAMSATQGAYSRRADEWDFMAKSATLELAQIDQQIATAQLHIDTLTKDLATHDLSTKNAQAARALLQSKYTNQELYEWMIGQTSSVCYSAYQLAFDMAKMAERCYGYELATDTTFIRYGYWDSMKKGLLAHQGLAADIKRMEAAYLQNNVREYELTKHISLADLDPGALLSLKMTGRATIQVPELVFAIDHPSHYCRRIASVAMSLVCSAGPYTTVAATLSLVSNKYRKSTDAAQGATTDKAKYAEDLGNDPRFAYNVGTISSIATSSATSDSGVFELNFHDERYLPFEGAGAISTWQVELPTVFQQIDWDTISDLILHLRYTAREGGSAFRRMTEKAMVLLSNEIVNSLSQQGWYLGLSLREQFPDAWWQLTQTGSTQLTVGTEHLPYLVRSYHPTVDAVTWAAKVSGSPASYAVTAGGTVVPLSRDATMKSVCTGTGGTLVLGTALSVAADTTKLEDLYLLVHYAITN